MDYQVIIAGGGPVGTALAIDLGLRGVTCAVVEKRSAPSTVPRGQNLTQRTMEHFARWGIADAVRDARVMPKGYPIGGVTAYHDLMGEFWHVAPGREIVNTYYAQANERLPQYLTEAVLRRRVSELDNVDVLLGHRVTAVEQDGTGVEVRVEAGDRTRTLRARYVVGCDGGQSLVREQSGIEQSGTNFDQVMVLVVLRSRALHEALNRYPERSTYRVLHPDLQGYWMYFGRVDVGEGWFFHAPVPPGVNPHDVDVTALLRRAAGLDVECEIDHVGLWDLRVNVADTYSSGRAFIAGDAAHTHPPYGGFGLNNGLEDAANLGWKLAGALEGWAGPALLDSYSAERQPVFRDIGENIIAAGIRRDREFLEKFTPGRDHAVFATAFEELVTSSRDLVRGYEPHYEGSPITVGAAGGVSGAHGVHSMRARAGHHLPPQRLSSGCAVFDELGPGFTLLALDSDDGSVAAYEQAATLSGVRLKVLRDSRAGGREDYEARLILVRPDEYVAWASDETPQHLHGAADVLRRAVGFA